MKQLPVIEPDKARKIVSELIFQVLVGKLCVREAIKNFPEDVEDPSVQCAWHALIHYEADEDFRKRDLLYCEQQDDYLEMIAFIFKDGNPLPQNIIQEYYPYYKRAMLPRSNSLRGLLKGLMRFISR